jgi:hypothetical protein
LKPFRRRSPIRERHQLAQFIDDNAAFIAQKGIIEYSRARAGHYAKVLFSEPAFLESVERSRWRAFPLGLAMVSEVVDGILRSHAVEGPDRQIDSLTALVLAVFDRYPTPEVLGNQEWREARAGLARRLQLIALHPPKRVIDIPEPFAREYWGLMPIHKDLRSRDMPTTHNYLKLTLCNIHEELTKRIDATALLSGLQASRSEELSDPGSSRA